MSHCVIYVYVCINKNISIHLFLQNDCETNEGEQQILCVAGLMDSFHSFQNLF